MTHFRGYVSSALQGAFGAICLLAAITVVGWCLYMLRWIDADGLVALLRISILGVPVVAASIPLAVVMLWLHDRRHSRRSS